MKKLLSLILALVMVLSLAACGGSEEEAAAPAAPAAPAAETEAPAAETEAAAEEEMSYDEIVAALAEMMPYAFIGADEDDLTYYLMFDEEISYGALCILDSEATMNMVTIGSVTEDENGILTIEDDQDDYVVSFSVVAYDDAEIPYMELTMQDGAVATMVAEEAATVADMILTIEMNTESFVPTFD